MEICPQNTPKRAELLLAPRQGPGTPPAHSEGPGNRIRRGAAAERFPLAGPSAAHPPPPGARPLGVGRTEQAYRASLLRCPGQPSLPGDGSPSRRRHRVGRNPRPSGSLSKAAAACLASRVPYGTPITSELLERISRAEESLARLGLSQFRVRHHGDIARIEVNPDDMALLTTGRIRLQVLGELAALGYRYITLDLAGYRQGSMNEVL